MSNSPARQDDSLLNRSKDDLAAEVRELRDQVDQLTDRLEQLEEQVDAKADRDHADAAHCRIETLKRFVVGETLTEADRRIRRDNGPLIDAVEEIDDIDTSVSRNAEALASVRSRITDIEAVDPAALAERVDREQKARTQEIARVNAKIEGVAEATGVDLTALPTEYGDAIDRLHRDGVGGVDRDTTKRLQRAAAILEYLAEFGHVRNDEEWAVIDTKQARKLLVANRDENLSSVQIRRVFEELVDLAGGSPRRVYIKKTRPRELYVQLVPGDCLLEGSEE